MSLVKKEEVFLLSSGVWPSWLGVNRLYLDSKSYTKEELEEEKIFLGEEDEWLEKFAKNHEERLIYFEHIKELLDGRIAECRANILYLERKLKDREEFLKKIYAKVYDNCNDSDGEE